MRRNTSRLSIIQRAKRASVKQSTSISTSFLISFCRFAAMFKRASSYSCTVFFEQSNSNSTGISSGAVSFMAWTPSVPNRGAQV